MRTTFLPSTRSGRSTDTSELVTYTRALGLIALALRRIASTFPGGAVLALLMTMASAVRKLTLPGSGQGSNAHQIFTISYT